MSPQRSEQRHGEAMVYLIIVRVSSTKIYCELEESYINERSKLFSYYKEMIECGIMVGWRHNCIIYWSDCLVYEYEVSVKSERKVLEVA